MRRLLLILLICSTSVLLPLPGVHANGQVITTHGVFQQYDSGFMIWRADSGLIWVFAYNGEVYPYVSTVYGRLPENPVGLAAPAGHFRPRLGFGKVWGNFAAVRSAVGWPTALEQGYTLTITYTAVDTIYTLSLPNEHVITVYYSNHWQNHGPNDGPLAPRTTYAAFQSFDNGYMIWRSDNQEVAVFIGGNRGSLQGYALGSYDYLPDNPVTDNPPAGHVKPINAFGRIWGHDAQLRQWIGWPTAAEQGYTLTMQGFENGQFNMSAPDGRIFKIYGTGWNF